MPYTASMSLYQKTIIKRLSNFEDFEAMIFQSVVFWDINLHILVGEHYHFAGTFPSLILEVTHPERNIVHSRRRESHRKQMHVISPSLLE
jgi:hypothetical protein